MNNLKKYEPNDNAPERQFVGMQESQYGDWYKVDDVEPILNIAQQLQDEICSILKNWNGGNKQMFLDKFALEHLPKLRKLSSMQ
jgi:hypothetical protein